MISTPPAAVDDGLEAESRLADRFASYGRRLLVFVLLPLFAWLAIAPEAFAQVWRALLALSRGLGRGMALFEQRYYLAGLLIAVILVIMLFIQ